MYGSKGDRDGAGSRFFSAVASHAKYRLGQHSLRLSSKDERPLFLNGLRFRIGYTSG